MNREQAIISLSSSDSGENHLAHQLTELMRRGILREQMPECTRDNNRILVWISDQGIEQEYTIIVCKRDADGTEETR